MSKITFKMTDFTFPAEIKDDIATFRIYLTLNYTGVDGKSGEAKEIMPGAGKGQYWECEKGWKGKPNYVRHATLPKIAVSKIGAAGGRAVFKDLTFKTLDELVVTIQDVEKDGKLENSLKEILKITFGVGLDLLSAGTALTIGNALTALKAKKNVERSEVEKKFDEMIEASKNEEKTRQLWEQIGDLSGLKSGDTFTVTGDSPKGEFSVAFSITIV